MSARRRRGGAGRTAAAASVTPDLFEDDARIPLERTPAARAAPPRPAYPLRSPPAPQPALRPRPRQLWYAVVFPELPVPEPSMPAAASVLPRLCLSAQQFTSLVSIEMPNALLLEIQGSVTLFGSLAVLHAAIGREWSRLSLSVQVATAPTTLAALWLARAGQPACVEDPGLLAGALATVPIACTAWDAERLQTLRSMGLTRIGELLRLPRSGLARRLGPAAVVDLDVALARQAAPRRAFVPRRRFRGRCDFETEIESVAYLQKALEPLLDRCAQFLRERQAGVQVLELKLRHRALPVTRVSVGLAGITGERRRLSDVLDEKLKRLELPAPVRAMELASGSLLPLSTNCAAGRTADTAPQLVERLRARLGEQAVYGVRSVAEHRPEAAWQRVHELCPGAMPGVNRHVRSVGAEGPPDMPRPVWLLEAPVLLPADPPLDGGPERIESGWWDGKGVARDYYIARPHDGARWWVFQERHTKRWYLHGVFA
jgi:protein ImuB